MLSGWISDSDMLSNTEASCLKVASPSDHHDIKLDAPNTANPVVQLMRNIAPTGMRSFDSICIAVALF